MTEVAIRVESLGKLYRIGPRERYKALRDTLMDTLYVPLRRLRSAFQSPSFKASQSPNGNDTIWALKDVSFEIKHGQVVGIIGRNGAGKSTLLKILSRITEPTEGRAIINGRVGSLLEVGTGFHSELTGRENIYLSGAILGMKHAEIDRNFHEIVAFAEIEKFVDTPVKHYSSGMYVRLAFAVAAHLEPDILLVDEVLAVGDAAFQKKCLGKMEGVARQGRTVLVVSHNMGIISQLCSRSVWLDSGALRDDGETHRVVNAYLTAADASAGTASAHFPEEPGKDSQVRAVRLLDAAGIATQSFSCDSPVIVEISYQIRRCLPGLYGCFQVSRQDGAAVMVSYSFDIQPNPLEKLSTGDHVIHVTIPPRTLAAGTYRIHFSTGSGRLATTIVDDPGIVGVFTLDDLTSIKGNTRLGFFSTLLNWDADRSLTPTESQRGSISSCPSFLQR